jgi:hypothetical protein
MTDVKIGIIVAGMALIGCGVALGQMIWPG